MKKRSKGQIDGIVKVANLAVAIAGILVFIAYIAVIIWETVKRVCAW